MGRPKSEEAIELEHLRAARTLEGGVCRSCGSTGAGYHHDSPFSGVCRSCSHREQAAGQKADYVGQTFNSHLVLSLAREKKKAGNKTERFWNVRCVACGLESTRLQHHLRKRACHVCLFEAKRAARAANPRRHAAHAALNRTRSGSYSRQIMCTLSEADMETLIFAPCSYCGLAPPEKGNGVDRLDSTKGYELGNVVACCWDCNRAKGSLTLGEFGIWLDRVWAHRRGAGADTPSNNANHTAPGPAPAPAPAIDARGHALEYLISAPAPALDPNRAAAGALEDLILADADVPREPKAPKALLELDCNATAEDADDDP